MTKRIITISAVFILVVALSGAVVSLVNRWLRENGLDSHFAFTVLKVGMVYAYYKMWRWFCRKLDLTGKEK